MSAPGTSYRFAGYRIDAVSRELRAPDGTSIPVTAKSLDVLLHLIEHRDRVVGKDELLAAVWPRRVVEENNLTQAISALRHAFGTAAGDHRYIVTVPGRGYRFVAALEATVAHTADGQAPSQSPQGNAASTTGLHIPRRAVRWGALAAITVALGVAAISALEVHSSGTASQASTAAAQSTLAILPFRPVDTAVAADRDPMLGLGMADTLITRLSHATSLRVLSLATVQVYAGKPTDPVRDGKMLGANFVVDGSTQQRGNSIRINARLLAMPDGRTVWAGTFDATPDQVFVAQDALAEAVSAALSHKYAARGFHSPCDGDDIQAYRADLRGRYLFNRPDPQRLVQALAAYREATRRDPKCARAWAGIAMVRRAQVIIADHDPRVEIPLANAAIERALAANPQSAQAYVAKGFDQFWYGWNWPAAEATLRHALALDPNLPEANYAMAHLLDNLGRHREAIKYAHAAAALDPLAPAYNALAARFVDDGGFATEARQRLDEVLKLEPDFWLALLFHGEMTFANGDQATGLRELERATELSGRNSQTLSRLAVAYARSGRRGGAVRILEELEARSRTSYVPPTTLAMIQVALGNRDSAFDMLERAYAQHDIGMAFLGLWFPTLQGDPRYVALMQRMHLTARSASSSIAQRVAGDPQPRPIRD
jgi:serine/threonine-protein kinase